MLVTEDSIVIKWWDQWIMNWKGFGKTVVS